MTDRQLLEKLYSKVTRLEKLLKVEEKKIKWVRIRTVMAETKLSRDQIRYIKQSRPGIAKPNGKQYLYNLTEFLKSA